jgi:tetratricopeptide (TPR) repeat protein/DNA-binding CsgD family transcriptional regulator
MDDDWGMATAKIGLGDIQFANGSYDSALIIYQQGLNNANKIDIRYKESGPLIQSYLYNRIGETYYKLKEYDKAISVLRNSADLAEEFTLPGRKADAAKYFSQIYEKLGNTSMAHDYFKIYNQLSDSIINAKNVSKITKLEMEYQYLKKQKEKEIEQLKKDAEYNRNMLIYEMIAVISIMIIASLFIILLLYRKNQKNKLHGLELAQKNLELEKGNLQNELEFKNKELATSVMYQLKKNNFIATVSRRLKELNLSLTSTNKKVLLNIVKELEANMSKETWEEFEYRFNSVHNDFYNGLLRDFPNLTPNELKICAFLKLNMTSKDISTITYTSPQSITVARHRLRTKLGLSRDDNLITFLSKY